MSLKSPFSTKIERGMYSAVVYEDGGLYVAEDDIGGLIIENTDAATVIQKAIDDYAEKGHVVVKPNVTLTSTLKILKSWSSVEFLGNITSTGVNAFELGDASNFLNFATLKVVQIWGGNKSAHGIVFKNATENTIHFSQISTCDIGMYFDALAGKEACENTIEGDQFNNHGTAAIRFSTAVGAMEGNYFRTSIFDCPIGFETLAGGSSKFQTYIGVIDCQAVGSSYDIKDAVGKNMFIIDFIRRRNCTIAKDSIVFNMHGVYYGEALAMPEGIIDFQNLGVSPILMWDFNRDSTGDWAKNNVTMGTPAKSVTRLTAGTWPTYISRDITLDGGQAQLIAIRYKYISGAKDRPVIFYSTATHAFTTDYYKQGRYYIHDGNWHVEIMDMSDLTTGGTDWIDNTITGLRFDPIYVSTGVMDIDYIAILGKGHPCSYNLDDALKTPASAAADGNKGDIRWDASYIYICTATDTWKRVAIATW